jgi:hypothetical protein
MVVLQAETRRRGDVQIQATKQRQTYVAEAGVELSAKSPGKLQVSPQSGAESGALLTICDPGLALVVAHWPNLPVHSRRTIVGMARKAAAKDVAPE